MAHQRRRDSMEKLELFDLDALKSNQQLCPPLPLPRTHRRYLGKDVTFKRYQFLCDMKRNKNDPIYAATRFFSTIPQSTPVQNTRRLLGSHLPLYIIKPLPSKSPMSPNPDSADILSDKKTTDTDDDEQNIIDDGSDKDDDDNDDDAEESSGSDDMGADDIIDNDDDVIDDDDDNNKGIMEQILNRDKRT